MQDDCCQELRQRGRRRVLAHYTQAQIAAETVEVAVSLPAHDNRTQTMAGCARRNAAGPSIVTPCNNKFYD